MPHHRSDVRQLADRLAAEYGGPSVSTGTVLALVYRAEHAMRGLGDLPAPALLELLEQVVRRFLTARATGHRPRLVA